MGSPGIFYICSMKMSRFLLVLCFSLVLLVAAPPSSAQCSVCTRTAQQLGEKSAKGLNAGILYLAFMPLILIGFIGYRYYQKNKSES